MEGLIFGILRYFYEHYLANIALNLEVRFNSGAHFTVYLKLELQGSGA